MLIVDNIKKTLVKNVNNQVSVLPEWKFISMSWIKSVSYTTYYVSVLLTCVIFRVAISTLTIAYITPFQLVVTIVLPRGLVRAYVRCTVHFVRLDDSQKLVTQHLHILWLLIIVATLILIKKINCLSMIGHLSLTSKHLYLSDCYNIRTCVFCPCIQ